MASRAKRKRKPKARPPKRAAAGGASKAGFVVIALLAFMALGTYLAAPLVGRAVRSAGSSGAGLLGPPSGDRVAQPCDPEERPVTDPVDEAARFQTQPVSSQMTIVELLADARSNEQRKNSGLPELEADEFLRDVARTHSQDMFRRGFFAHQNPDQEEATHRVHRSHRSLVGEVGENIWMCSGCWQGDVDAVVGRMVTGEQGWMNSQGHRENILRDTFTHGVVGVWQNGQDVWATQVFSATRGYLKADAPRRIAAGACVALEVDPYPESATAAARFDVFSPSGDRAVIDGSPLGKMVIDTAAGQYNLRFHFPKGPHRYSLVTGPTVQIQ